jgi:tetratricopeptide (TPR) repeat protein
MIERAHLCHSLPPLAAYSCDFPEPRVVPEALGDWLHTGLCLWRIAQMEERERPSGFASAAEVLRTISKSSPNEAPRGPGGDAADRPSTLAVLAALLSRAAGEDTTPATETPVTETPVNETPATWSSDLARMVHEGAEYLEGQGAFHLAYSLLSGFRRAVVSLSRWDVGRILALQGRIARQLGALDTADDNYRVAQRISREVREPDLYVRAMLGRGVIAATRGNYPKARVHFRRSLRAAQRSGLIEHESAAHNALLMAAIAAKDLDSALTHGWAALAYSSKLPDRHAEVLVNLAEVALLAGHPESALAACVEALGLTRIDRVLLAGYGTGANAAARLRRRAVLDRIAADSLKVIQRSGQQLDKAYTLVELAEAYATVAGWDEARTFLIRAREIAEPAGFFEILHRADIVAAQVAAPQSPARRNDLVAPSDVPAGAVTRDSSRYDSTYSLSPASRRVIRSLAELRS